MKKTVTKINICYLMVADKSVSCTFTLFAVA